MTIEPEDPLVTAVAAHVTAARAARRIGLPAREIVQRYRDAGHRPLRVGRRVLLEVDLLAQLVRSWRMPSRQQQESRLDLIVRRTKEAAIAARARRHA